MHGDDDWMTAAAALAARGRPLSRPNPAVAAVIVAGDRVVGRGFTQPGGRPHAEAAALAMAGAAAHGATLYVTLEPCAHRSARGPACADLVVAAGLARVVIGCTDPDPRTAGAGIVASVALLPSTSASMAKLISTSPGRSPNLGCCLPKGCAIANSSPRWVRTRSRESE